MRAERLDGPESAVITGIIDLPSTSEQSTTEFALAHLPGIKLFLSIRRWHLLTLCRGKAIVAWQKSSEWRHRQPGTDRSLLEKLLAIRTGTMSSAWILARLNSLDKTKCCIVKQIKRVGISTEAISACPISLRLGFNHATRNTCYQGLCTRNR